MRVSLIRCGPGNGGGTQPLQEKNPGEMVKWLIKIGKNRI